MSSSMKSGSTDCAFAFALPLAFALGRALLLLAPVAMTWQQGLLGRVSVHVFICCVSFLPAPELAKQPRLQEWAQPQIGFCLMFVFIIFLWVMIREFSALFYCPSTSSWWCCSCCILDALVAYPGAMQFARVHPPEMVEVLQNYYKGFVVLFWSRPSSSSGHRPSSPSSWEEIQPLPDKQSFNKTKIIMIKRLFMYVSCMVPWLQLKTKPTQEGWLNKVDSPEHGMEQEEKFVMV